MGRSWREDEWGLTDGPVADIAVAMHAVEHLAGVAGVRVDAIDHLLVAADAVGLEHRGVFGTNHDGLMKVLESETLGMPGAVFGFAQVFGDERVRRVAIVARGDGVVGRLQPAVVLVAHDVAIYARLRVVGKIGEPFRVMERVTPEPREYADQPHPQN